MSNWRESYDTMCFACGKQNPIGLQLEFEETEEGYQTYWQPTENHSGYPGVVHGGLLSTIMDEAMGRYLFVKGIDAPTAELTVRFKKPVPVGEKLRIVGKVVKHKGRLFYTEAHMYLANGQVAVYSEGRFIVPTGDFHKVKELIKAREESNDG